MTDRDHPANEWHECCPHFDDLEPFPLPDIVFQAPAGGFKESDRVEINPDIAVNQPSLLPLRVGDATLTPQQRAEAFRKAVETAAELYGVEYAGPRSWEQDWLVLP